MPICRSCLKGFNSDINICPHCGHDKSKKSFRALLSLIFLVGLSLFLYAKFFSKYTLTVLHDGVPQEGVEVLQLFKGTEKTNDNGNVWFRKGFCLIGFPIDEVRHTWDFHLEADTQVNISYKTKSVQVTMKRYGMFESSYRIPFATIKQIQTINNPPQTGQKNQQK